MPALLRSSALPLSAAFGLAVLGMVLLRPWSGGGQGSGGPEFRAGPLLLPTKQAQWLVAAPLHDVVESCTSASSAAWPHGDGPGPGPWRLVTLVADARDTVTRAVAYGLGEELVRAGHAGGVTHLDVLLAGPDDDRRLPLSMDRVLHVERVAGDPPAAPGGAIAWTVRVTEIIPRLPAGHPGQGLQGGPAYAERTLLLHHRSRGDAAAGWPRWYAGVGRSMGRLALRTLCGATASGATLVYAAPPGLGAAPVAWDAEEGGLIEPRQASVSIYGTAHINVVAWTSAFQTPLVRGWIGRIPRPEIDNHKGGSADAVQVLIKKLEDGQWQRESAPSASGPTSWRLWSKDLEPRTAAQSATPAPGAAPHAQRWTFAIAVAGTASGSGPAVALWHERAQPAQRFLTWIGEAEALLAQSASSSAQTGIRHPRTQLHQLLHDHLDCERLPVDLRQRARAAVDALAPDALAPAR